MLQRCQISALMCCCTKMSQGTHVDVNCTIALTEGTHPPNHKPAGQQGYRTAGNAPRQGDSCLETANKMSLQSDRSVCFRQSQAAQGPYSTPVSQSHKPQSCPPNHRAISLLQQDNASHTASGPAVSKTHPSSVDDGSPTVGSD